MSRTIGAKLKENDAQKFSEYCRARGVSKSSAIREMVLRTLARHSYLDDDRRKVLLRSFRKGGGRDG